MQIPRDSQNRQELKIIFLGIASISGKLRCETGLHIGAGNDELKIGGIDRYVIKTADNKPYIPGSSFKGKGRSLFEKWQGLSSNRRGADKIYRYEADDIDTALSCELSRLFGSTSNDGNKLNFPARLIVRDLLPEKTTLEKKSENTIDRLSAHANPRTNERVSDGSVFKLYLDYNLEVISDDYGNIYLGAKNNGDPQKSGIDGYIADTIDDLKNIFNVLLLLQHSYLGGNGSRGYGRVSFTDLTLEIKTISELLSIENTAKPIIFESTKPKEIRQEIESKKVEIKEYISSYYTKVCSR
ncbi:type III-A CRISPR-associated RAMP protein Csm3 [Chlorobaculum sp. 24CR]|uniref:type III-A CRISPR-associated RAMP protein Csm3 n=1 Tax=Chlorobaculum sp. 24CR TaxID=2508878 RepID=UPI00100BCD28|nr:type III-A CRISPR-associated RAMP protein Csm3 [Chlorobaculum sp. 24CR]RXK84873.1 type III-A CRISPR-associated RAMP protein Csm3 [Chlorobaculum sp. 24CR]